MSAPISPQQTTFTARHREFMKLVCPSSSSAIGASILLIPGLIVIVSSCLCLTLPGVNVIRQVVLPGVLPGTGAVLLSIPLWVATFRYGQKKTAKWKEVSDALKAWVGDPPEDLVKKPKDERAAFIDAVVAACGGADKFNKGKVLDEIKECFPKKKEEQSKPITTFIGELDAKKSLLLKKF